jgi:tetratricopeptide (TPR) repeat protein
MPILFQTSGQASPGAALEAVQPDSKWLDAVGHLSLYSGRTIPDTRQAFENLLLHEADPAHRAVLYAGIARCLNSQMRLREGGPLLGQAWSLLGPETQGDPRAFVMLEMARFMLLIGNGDGAGSLLDQVSRQAGSEFLKRQHLYYRLALAASRGEAVEAELEQSAQWFLEQNQRATAIAHFRMMAQLERAEGRDDRAEALCRRGLDLCGDPSLQFCKALMLNDLGLMHFQQGQRELAMTELFSALDLAEYPYSRIDTLDLIGRCLKQEGRLAEAARYLVDGLNIAMDQGTLIIVPALCLYLGQCHEGLTQTELARHFYSRAYRSSMELLRFGYPATATRLEAIQTFVRFTGENPGSFTGQVEENSDEDFAFALAHTLKEIRTIFQNTLLDLKVQEHGTQKEAVFRLGIAHRTLSNVRQRHRRMGNPPAPAGVTRFIRLNPHMDWKQINQKFDDTLLAWLYQRYDQNRKQMSERLGLSYPHLSALISRAVRSQETGLSERSA